MVPVPGHLMAGADISGMQMQQNGAAYGPRVILWGAWLTWTL